MCPRIIRFTRLSYMGVQITENWERKTESSLLSSAPSSLSSELERVMGIEPTPSAWKAEVLPLNYTRLGSTSNYYSHHL